MHLIYGAMELYRWPGVWRHQGCEFVKRNNCGEALLSLEHPGKNEGSVRGWSMPQHGRKMGEFT